MYNRCNMKTLIFATTVLMSASVFSQSTTNNNTLDINYTALFKDTFTLKLNSKLSEDNNWALKGFSGGGAYNIGGASSRFSLTYDLWRGNELNAPISKRFGLAFSSQSRFNTVSFSMYQTDALNAPSGLAGKLDITMKFK